MEAVNNVIPFQFETTEIRVVRNENGEPMFVAKDVCDVLEIGNSRMALQRLDDDQKGVSSIDTLGGFQSTSIVTESGLYTLVFGSRKPQAKRFTRWVTETVLPTLRKTGTYTVGQPTNESKVQSIDEICDALNKWAPLRNYYAGAGVPQEKLTAIVDL